ncbi:uncharacterized protein LOC119400813 [Rhipicephalus sanguineus]|uniref:uncharacterized protein LOC119400813 n=1 Tax=Rhipicephalus sanguineus TaxID=34632 RepID=UPI0018938E43|nr:uncharacterized protein LOC119400813 [Rhipicephalus sanguineus]
MKAVGMICYALLFAAMAAFPTAVFGAAASDCASFSLPNILDIGECLGASGDLCSADTEGIGVFLGKLLECTFQSLGTLDLRSQLYLIIEFLKYLLARNDFDILLPFLTGACKGIGGFLGPLTGGILTLSCNELYFDENAVCGEPILISLQATAPFTTCLNTTGLTCAADTPVDEPAAVGFLRVLACLVGYVLNTAPTEIVDKLGCGFVGSLHSLLGSGGVSSLTPLICSVQGLLRIECSVISC